MSKIGISALFLRTGRVGGAEYMLKNLIEGFSRQAVLNDQIIVYRNNAEGWDHTCHSIKFVDLSPRRTTNRFVTEASALSRNLDQLDAMLFPNYFTPAITRLPRIVTVIHDLAYRHYPENFSHRKRQWLRLTHLLTLARADHVVTISEFTRQDILRVYGARFEPNVSVIPNPITWERFEETEAISSEIAALATAPFLLSVAAHYSHKNLETLIRAFALIRGDQPELSLLLAGQLRQNLVGVAAAAGPIDLIRQLRLQDAVRVTGHISDADLGHLYRQAELIVFPSLFEGFGMPPVEALGLGKPVLTTRMASIPEVTLGAAHYVTDAFDHYEMAARISEMLHAPVKYAPTREEVERIRSYYAPRRIAELYRRTLIPSGQD